MAAAYGGDGRCKDNAGREYKVPELPHFSVDGYCPENRTIYEFFGCYFHGHTCQPFRGVITTSGDTLADDVAPGADNAIGLPVQGPMAM